jgi:hypothetical protein
MRCALHQALPDALRDLSPLPLGMVSCPAQCVARRSTLRAPSGRGVWPSPHAASRRPGAPTRSPGGYVVREQLAYLYSRENEAEARQAKVLTTLPRAACHRRPPTSRENAGPGGRFCQAAERAPLGNRLRSSCARVRRGNATLPHNHRLRRPHSTNLQHRLCWIIRNGCRRTTQRLLATVTK